MTARVLVVDDDATVRDVVEREIAPHVEDWERAGIFPAHDLFPRLGQPCPAADEHFEDTCHDPDSTVAADLHYLLARVGMRRPHVGDQHLIEFRPGAGVDKITKAHPMRGPAFHGAAMPVLEDLPHNRQRVRPADANDA